MSDPGDKLQAVWTAIFTECDKVSGLIGTEGSDQNLYYGLFEPPVGSPVVMIDMPGMKPIGGDTGGNYYEIKCTIYIFYADPNIPLAMRAAMDVAGLIWRELVDDRELGGEISELFDPMYNMNPTTVKGYQRQFVDMTITCHVWIDFP